MSYKSILKLVWFPFLTILIIYQLGPIEFNSNSYMAVIFLTLNYLLFTVGLSINKKKINSSSAIKNILTSFDLIYDKNYSKLLKISYFFTLLYFISFFISRIFSNQISIFDLETIGQNRNIKSFERNIGIDRIGILSTLLSGFPLLILTFNFVYYKFLSKKLIITNFIIFFIFLYTSIVSGGRFVILIGIIFFIILNYILKPYKKNKLLKVYYLYLIIPLLILISLIFNMTIIRLSDSHQFDDINRIITSFGPTSVLDIRDSWSFIDNLSYDLKINLIFFIYYITHSIFFLNDIIINYSSIDGAPFFGQLQFYQFTLFIDRFTPFTLPSVFSILDQLPQSGVYLSIVGPMIADFGLYSHFLLSPLFGFLTGKVFISTNIKPNLFNVLFCTYFIIVIIFSPVISMLGTSLMFPLFLNIILLFLINKFILK